jgi:phosphate/sulfate permease
MEVRKKINEKFIESLKGYLQIYRFQNWVALASFISGGLIVFAISAYDKNLIKEDFVNFLPEIFIGGIVAVVLYGFITFFLRLSFQKKIDDKEQELYTQSSEFAISKLLDKDKDFYAMLIQINFKYLDEYYQQTQVQARNSFSLSAFAAVAGFATLIIGIFQFKGASAGNNVPLIIIVSGVLSEFIAAVFFYLYTKTIQKMSQYHENLMITQNINLALKIAREMTGEDKTKALAQIVDRLTLISRVENDKED